MMTVRYQVVFEFAGDVVRVCRSQRRGRGYYLADCFSFSVPPAEESASREIRRQLKSRDWRPACAVLSLPRQEAMGRLLCLPSREENEIREMALLRIFRETAGPTAREIVSDIQVVGHDDEGNSLVRIFMMQEARVLRRVRILERAGIVSGRVTLSTQGAINWFSVHGDKCAFLLSADALSYDLSMVGEGRCVSSRAFCARTKEGLVHEVKLSIEQFRRGAGRGAGRCDDLYLSGTISGEQQEYLSRHLGKVVRRLPALEEYREVDPAVRAQLNGTAAGCSSIAGKALFHTDVYIDLTPPGLRLKLSRQRARRWQRLIFVGWGVFLLTVSVLLSRAVSEDIRVLKKMQAASVDSASTEKEMGVMTQRLFWEDAVLRNGSHQKIWDWFYGHASERTAFTRLDIKNGQGVSAEGRSGDIPSVVSLLILLEDSGLFSKVRLDHLGKSSELSEFVFRISAASRKGRS